MNSGRDHQFLGFLLGELPPLKRLDVRLRLALSAAARRRFAELERTAGAVAGAIGVGGVAAFHANQRVKLRRLLIVDSALAAAAVAMLALGCAVAWRALNPGPAMAAQCMPKVMHGPISSDQAGHPHMGIHRAARSRAAQ